MTWSVRQTQPSGVSSTPMTREPVKSTAPLLTVPVNVTEPRLATTCPPPHGYSMRPLLVVSTGKSTQLGRDGVVPVTTSVGRQPPLSQSASTTPSQSSSLPLHDSISLGPLVQPAHVITSSS